MWLINCGEQDIEDGGLSVSMSFGNSSEKDTPDEAFICMIDSLLGVSEFIAECGYKFALVGIDYDRSSCENTNIKKFIDFNEFLNQEENKEVKELFTKYCKYEYDEPLVEDGTIWYSFYIENIKAEMSSMF